MPGSSDPALVPIINPSRGVMPIEVATERPPSTAVTEQPLPRCATTSPSSVAGRASSSAARSTAHSTESPWKPYRRIPTSDVQCSGTG